MPVVDRLSIRDLPQERNFKCASRVLDAGLVSICGWLISSVSRGNEGWHALAIRLRCWASAKIANVMLATVFCLGTCLPGCQPDARQESLPSLPADRSDPGVGKVGQGIPIDRLRLIGHEHSSENVRSSVQFEQMPEDQRPDFVYENGSRGDRLMVEATGGGCAWLDMERDGDCDIYLVQGGVPNETPDDNSVRDRIWRLHFGQFTDVTESAGLKEAGYGQGVAAGDYDNDGFEDLFVTNVGSNRLLKNLGDGTWEVIQRWGGEDSRVWSTSAAWGDIDSDGDLDLYVCNYVDFDPFHPKICLNDAGIPSQCGPNQVDPVADELYVNYGHGQFQPSAAQLGVAGPDNRALGVVIADLVGDPVPEIYVANDATANFLFLRQPDGTYREEASQLGGAVNSNGVAQASMGVAPCDFNHDGQMDLYVTHFEGEWNTLYQNLGEFGFKDATADFHAVQSTLPWVGFGTVAEDFDLNGSDDIFIANGHIDDLGRKRVLEMPPQLLSFNGNTLEDIGAAAGKYFASRKVGRGCAQADFDDDGDFDLAVVHHSRPADVLVNTSQSGHWLAVELTGIRSSRRGTGSKVVVRQGKSVLTQQMYGGGSYCSSRQPKLIFGLGNLKDPCEIEVQWPTGVRQQLLDVSVDQSVVIREELHDE